MKRRDDAVEETEEETEESTAAAPSRRSASRAKDNGDERGAARRRRPRDDDDDAEESDFKKPDLSGGWDRSQKRRDTTGGDFADEWRPEPEERLVLLLEDEPYVSYGQHWVDERLSMTKKKGFICLEDDCPLCDIGDNVRAMYQFNAYVFDGDGKGHHVALVCGNRLFDQLKDIHQSKRQGPLTAFWRVMKRTGKGGNTGYNVDTIRDDELDDVADEYGVDIPSDEVLDKIKLHTAEEVVRQMWSPKRLGEVAAELSS